MSEQIVYSDMTLAQALGMVRDEYHRHGKIRVKADCKRSIEQNSLSHAWYAQIAAQLPQDDASGWKAHCKLHHGVPILRTEDEDFRAMYDSAIKGLTYEQKLAVMAYLPVTSLMNKDQLSRYLDAVQREFAQQNVFLEFPMERAA